ncbi:MAG: DUF924 family protein [Bosea sp. (in: a-proteobacteria)]|uniref:DUF924 family protein n=1 Tax=Bosea sp. (in: a-proteobacteria) TaxID=1871050 RepID=UPI002736C7E7|nr:DUF924 family protein [Bosea sp. (in: a-proteobacteria)]MDP3254688.1 DUF924 family protein [Bosea sp. (in: a-proteobacteria)]MDP3318688.1 DUF924 family protein [Bosea sp. (in: a-proteobacteria)]
MQTFAGGPRRGAGDTAQSVIDFWRDAGAERWFRKDAAFDSLFRERFLSLHFAAARRELDGWADSAPGSLALAILLDQLPRNGFRGTAHMYATDPLARHFARLAQARGHGEAIEPELRLFLHLPFCHSEDVADQDLSVALSTPLGGEAAEHAEGHREVVRRFGRFPHRNALLGRETTPEEAAFLAEGGFAG